MKLTRFFLSIVLTAGCQRDSVTCTDVPDTHTEETDTNSGPQVVVDKSIITLFADPGTVEIENVTVTNIGDEAAAGGLAGYGEAVTVTWPANSDFPRLEAGESEILTVTFTAPEEGVDEGRLVYGGLYDYGGIDFTLAIYAERR